MFNQSILFSAYKIKRFHFLKYPVVLYYLNIAGWGTTTEPLPVLDYSTPPAYLPPPAASSVLREAPLKVVTQQVCQSAVVGAVKVSGNVSRDRKVEFQ